MHHPSTCTIDRLTYLEAFMGVEVDGLRDTYPNTQDDVHYAV